MQKIFEPVVALVVAAGSGSRLGAPVPKALVEVDGRPLVARSVDALAAGGCGSAVVVAPAPLVDEFTALLAGAAIEVRVVAGGARRQDSVAAGLDACPAEGIVLVHDAARPFVPAAVVRAVIDAVTAGHPCVIPAVPVVDTIRRRTPDGSELVDRSSLVAVQTPQGFDLAALREAHRQAAGTGLEATDDASVCEAAGIAVHVVEGSPEAMKITTPHDLIVARALLASRA